MRRRASSESADCRGQVAVVAWKRLGNESEVQSKRHLNAWSARAPWVAPLGSIWRESDSRQERRAGLTETGIRIYPRADRSGGHRGGALKASQREALKEKSSGPALSLKLGTCGAEEGARARLSRAIAAA